MCISVRRKHAFGAIKSGDLARLQRLVLNKTDANWKKPNRPWALLDEAVNSEQHGIAKWLLGRGANPNTIHFESGRNSELGRFLYALVPLDMYFSPLASAIKREDAGMIRLLLDAGANLSLPRMKFQGRVETCEDMLKEIPGLMQKVEALAIAGGVPIQASMPIARCPRSL